MKRMRKKYEMPKKLWSKEKIERERGITKSFGLKKKREIWNSEALLRKYRRMARDSIARKDKESERMIIENLAKLGLLNKSATLDDVLGLKLEDMLERRLQTVIFRKGLASSAKQARQLITHGKVTINERKAIYPSYLVSKDDEEKIKVVK